MCHALVQVAFNSPGPQPPPPLPAAVRAAFAATNVAGFDNGTLLTPINASSGPQDAGINSTAADRAPDGIGLLPGSNSTQQVVKTELLSLSVKPDYLVPLKVVTGISSSFITNMVKPGGAIGRELTGTEVLQ
jgi:hypothetical protein